jgi:hypothetical protein
MGVADDTRAHGATTRPGGTLEHTGKISPVKVKGGITCVFVKGDLVGMLKRRFAGNNQALDREEIWLRPSMQKKRHPGGWRS